jgi:hypothetical protein
MKNTVFWDIKAHFVLHRKHITATSANRLMHDRFEVLTAVTVRNAVF